MTKQKLTCITIKSISKPAYYSLCDLMQKNMSKMGSHKFKAVLVCTDDVTRNHSIRLEPRFDVATKGPSI